MSNNGQLRDERVLLRVGGVCAMVGALGFFASFGIHGDLPSGTEPAFRYIAARPEWRAIHLVAIVSVVLWVGALVALAGSLTRGASRALGQLGVASVLLGASIFILDFAVDGFSLKSLADRWAAAPPDQQAQWLRVGDTLILLLSGTFRLYIAFLLGLPFVLFGLAVVFSRVYPARLGWVGVVGGGGSLVVGLAQFLRLPFIPIWLFVLFGPLVIGWLVVMGVAMWRYAGALPAGASGAAGFTLQPAAIGVGAAIEE